MFDRYSESFSELTETYKNGLLDFIDVFIDTQFFLRYFSVAKL